MSTLWRAYQDGSCSSSTTISLSLSGTVWVSTGPRSLSSGNESVERERFFSSVGWVSSAITGAGGLVLPRCSCEWRESALDCSTAVLMAVCDDEEDDGGGERDEGAGGSAQGA